MTCHCSFDIGYVICQHSSMSQSDDVWLHANSGNLWHQPSSNDVANEPAQMMQMVHAYQHIYKNLRVMHAPIPSHMHTHMHTDMQTHMFVHSPTHTRIHAYMHIYTHKCIYTHTHACTHAYIRTHMHAHIHTYIYVYIDTYIPAYQNSLSIGNHKGANNSM